MESLSIYSDVLLRKSCRTNPYTHEKMQQNRQFGIQVTCFWATVVHRSFNEEKAESTTIILISDSSRLAAPILLPHPTTLKPCCSKNRAALLACLDYLIPKVTQGSFPFPHPSKSKHANATSWGISLSMFMPSILQELFPCKYRIQYLVSFTG